MSADFSRAMAHIIAGITAHADRDGLTGVQRAVFIDRGGHAPGEHCPSAEPPDPHDYWCQWPDDECNCAAIPLTGPQPDLPDPGEPERVYPASWLEVAFYAVGGAVVAVGLVVWLVQAVTP